MHNIYYLGLSGERSLPFGLLVSSPELLGSQGKLKYTHAPAPVHPPISEIFSSKTTWPSKAKFHVEHPWEGERKFV